VKDQIIKFASLYSDLQVYKHIAKEEREQKLYIWSKAYTDNQYSYIKPWEFWAATGSTLSIFCLIAMAGKPNLKSTEVDKTVEVYFPWINGMHILLDYFIDMDEDSMGGDLNFINYYQSKEEFMNRMLLFIQESFDGAKKLSNPEFHRTIIEGLLAMYLSDPKIHTLDDKKISKFFLNIEKSDANYIYKMCKVLRKVKSL
jgi:tetraprenyl-beta-curcumene synthase